MQMPRACHAREKSAHALHMRGLHARLLNRGEVVARGARHADAARRQVEHLVAIGGDARVERGHAEVRPCAPEARPRGVRGDGRVRGGRDSDTRAQS